MPSSPGTRRNQQKSRRASQKPSSEEKAQKEKEKAAKKQATQQRRRETDRKELQKYIKYHTGVALKKVAMQTTPNTNHRGTTADAQLTPFEKALVERHDQSQKDKKEKFYKQVDVVQSSKKAIEEDAKEEAKEQAEERKLIVELIASQKKQNAERRKKDREQRKQYDMMLAEALQASDVSSTKRLKDLAEMGTPLKPNGKEASRVAHAARAMHPEPKDEEHGLELVPDDPYKVARRHSSSDSEEEAAADSGGGVVRFLSSIFTPSKAKTTSPMAMDERKPSATKSPNELLAAAFEAGGGEDLAEGTYSPRSESEGEPAADARKSSPAVSKEQFAKYWRSKEKREIKHILTEKKVLELTNLELDEAFMASIHAKLVEKDKAALSHAVLKAFCSRFGVTPARVKDKTVARLHKYHDENFE